MSKQGNGNPRATPHVFAFELHATCWEILPVRTCEHVHARHIGAQASSEKGGCIACRIRGVHGVSSQFLTAAILQQASTVAVRVGELSQRDFFLGFVEFSPRQEPPISVHISQMETSG